MIIRVRGNRRRGSLIWPIPSSGEYVKGMSDLVRLIVPFLALVIIDLLPLPVEDRIKYTLGTFVCVSMLWTFGPLPLPVTAILVPVLLTFFGIFPAAEALQPFADPVVYLIMGGLILAEAFRKNGIDRRLSYMMIARLGGDPRMTLLAFMLVSAILSMWVSNTATVALLIPVVLSVTSGGRSKVQYLLGIGFASAIGGMATITGSPPNAVTSGLLARETAWTFVDWMTVGLPVSIILLFLCWQILIRLFPEGNTIDIAEVRGRLADMGPLSNGERKTLLIFFPTVVLWIVGAEIGTIFDFPPGVMSATIVALAASFLLFTTKALEWEDARHISWEIFLIVGAGLALGEGMEVSGTAEWIAEGLVSAIGSWEVVMMVLVVTAATVAITNLMSNTATAAIFIPILIGISATLGMDPKFLVLACGFAVSLSFITPIGTPPLTLIYSQGEVGRQEMARAGLVVTVPAIMVLVPVIYLIVEFGVV
jgi:sodium-dependent dicarboxylate transporter 2/3/5